MLKSYNSFIKRLLKYITVVATPVVVLVLVFLAYKFKFLNTAGGNEYENKMVFALVSALIGALGTACVWSIVDYYTFTATLNAKTQGIEFLKTSKKGAKYFMDVVIMDIIVRTVVYVITMLLIMVEVKIIFGVGFKDYLSQTYVYYAVGYGLGCLMVFINRHFRNSQAFTLTTYFITTGHTMGIAAAQFIIGPGGIELPEFVKSHIVQIIAVTYVMIGIISNGLILWKTKYCIDKSWYND